MSRPIIATLGELLVEFVCTDTDTQHARPAPYIGPFPSGAPGIFIDQAAQIIGQAVFAGAVGDDPFGRVILDRLRAHGVDDRLIAVTDRPTGTAHVAYASDGSRAFVFNIGHSAAAMLPDAATIVAGFAAAGVTHLHISGSTLGDPALRATARTVCDSLVPQGVILSIDPNIRPELLRDAGYIETLRALIALSHHVLPSDADAAALWPGADFAALAAALPHAHSVVLKRGDAGCIGTDRRAVISLPADPATVIDPTGAGDCFCATYIALTALGTPFARALSEANAAGARAVTVRGPMEGNSPPTPPPG